MPPDAAAGSSTSSRLMPVSSSLRLIGSGPEPISQAVGRTELLYAMRTARWRGLGLRIYFGHHIEHTDSQFVLRRSRMSRVIDIETECKHCQSRGTDPVGLATYPGAHRICAIFERRWEMAASSTSVLGPGNLNGIESDGRWIPNQYPRPRSRSSGFDPYPGLRGPVSKARTGTGDPIRTGPAIQNFLLSRFQPLHSS